jgi:hypothetical protein
MVMSRDQNRGRGHSIKIDNGTFERVEQLQYLGTTLNSIEEEIMSRLKSGNACHNSMQNRLSSSLLSKNVKITDIQNYNSVCFLYNCEIWSLTLREERRLRVFENRVLRRIFGPKRDEERRKWKKTT